MKSELIAAAPAGQLTLHYQPIFDLAADTPNAVEALLRWQHPTQGLLAAGDLIGVANESGLLARLGPWVIAQPCQQLARWDRELKDRSPAQLFLNLSISQLVHPGRIDAAARSLAQLDPARLLIEITESEMLDNTHLVTDAVQALLGLGCQLAIDDFEAGYSALSRLIDLPEEKLKIDQSFVQQLSSRPEAASIIAAVLLLAHNLRIIVTAEGVEDERTHHPDRAWLRTRARLPPQPTSISRHHH